MNQHTTGTECSAETRGPNPKQYAPYGIHRKADDEREYQGSIGAPLSLQNRSKPKDEQDTGRQAPAKSVEQEIQQHEAKKAHGTRNKKASPIAIPGHSHLVPEEVSCDCEQDSETEK